MNPQNILIVDDDPGGRQSLEALLNNQGYHLILAENGQKALMLAEQCPPDLILLDVMMPGLDGFEVCRRLRVHPNLAEVPVLMLTALDDDQSRLKGLQSGADDFISKPYQVAELRARIKTITRLNRYRLLTEERAKITWIIDNAEEAYIVTDLEDRIRYANARACLYLGLEQDNYYGLSFVTQAQAHYQCQPEILWQHWPPKECTKQQHCYLIRPESLNTNALWLEVNIRAANTLDRLICLRDVSNQINTQRNMHTFHGMIQHKLRTPLEPLVSGLSFITRSTGTIDPKIQKEFILMALNGAQQLHSQISEILEYISSGHLLDVNDPVPLTQSIEIIKEVIKSHELEKVTITLEPTLYRYLVPLTSRNLQWIIWELLGNAKKFHPSQTPQVRVELFPDSSGTHLCLRCTDDGLHLAPDQIAGLWMPYYQAEKYFTGQAPGMGLGLAMIARLIWQIGGHCRLYNRQDKPGIVVELTLPLCDEDGTLLLTTDAQTPSTRV
jgi:two-component system, cell cycle response regulator